MIHVRAWRTMTMVTVEVTCTHSDEQGGRAHLMMRATDVPDDDDLSGVLESIADTLTACRQHIGWGDDLGQTDDCGRL